jgi:hypothetical protein
LLRISLTHLGASDCHDFEVLVSDDASPAAAAVRSVVCEAGANLIRLEQRKGPAAARNRAAKNARGSILVFMDADTAVHPDTLTRIARKFEEKPELDAVMGSYDRKPAYAGRVSRFRNLLHSFVHHESSQNASTFWAGCGAVRAIRFRAVGGFDESFSAPSIEDVEFGLRLRASGASIELDPEIQVTHHKAWTLATMVKTDLFARAIPWAGLLRRYPMPLDLNFKLRDRLSGALFAITPVVALVAIIHGGLWWSIPLICLLTVGLLNRRLFRFIATSGSWREALLSFPLLLVYLATCVTGLIAGTVLAEHRRDRLLWPVVAGLGVLLLAIQISSGAVTSEFAGYPDEAGQFFSGLILHDYLAELPRENPIAWAGQYYLHYPKVAIGHWPPLYHAMEALWWLVLGPSRFTSMALQWFIGLLALTMLYQFAREFLPLSITLTVLALTIATPVFQTSLEQTMADLCCLLWSVLLMQASVRLIREQDGRALFLVVLWLTAAALTKGTAVGLVPVPALALLLHGRPVRIPMGWLAAGAAVILAAGGWYLANGGIAAWGGMSTAIPWPGPVIGQLAGWGFVALAVLGLGRNPLALVAGSVVASMLGVSYVVRAMREDRHWIIALPAILLLAGLGAARFRRWWVPVLLLALGLVFFPFSWRRQPQSEFRDLTARLRVALGLKRPARMLVSSTEFGEGSFIAAVALTEWRPSSFVARATKILADEGWNGEAYHLLAPDHPAVLERLDELAIDAVILHTPQVALIPPHHVLLRGSMSRSPVWTICASAKDLVAYCRVRAPGAPRVPLHLKVYGWDFLEKIQP